MFIMAQNDTVLLSTALRLSQSSDITSWFGNLMAKSKSQITSLVKTAGKILGTPVLLNPQSRLRGHRPDHPSSG